MKDSYEKDPFAEYDKYWDDLEEKEEKTNRKHRKNYRFDDSASFGEQQSDEVNKKAISLFVGILVLFMIFGIFVPVVFTIFSFSEHFMMVGFGNVFMFIGPSFGLIFIIVVILIILNAAKKN